MEFLRAHRAHIQLLATLLVVGPYFAGELFKEAASDDALRLRGRRVEIVEPPVAAVDAMLAAGPLAATWQAGDGHNPFRLTTDREPLPPVRLAEPSIPDPVALRLPVLPLPEPAVLSAALARPARPAAGDPIDPTPIDGGGDDPVAVGEPSLADRVRDHDRVYTGADTYQEGKIIDEVGGKIVLRMAAGSALVTIPGDRVARVERAQTLQEVYRAEAGVLAGRSDWGALLDLVEECGRYEQLRATGIDLLEGYVGGAGRDHGDAYLLLVDLLRQDFDLDRALGAVDRAIEEVGLEEADLFEARARLRMAMGETFADWALADARRALAIERSGPRAVLVAGLTEATGDLSGALLAFRDAAGRDATDADALLGHGRLLFRLGRLDEALAVLEGIGTVDSTLLAGATMYLQGDLEGAEARFRAVLAARPGHPEATFDLAVTLAGSGRLAEVGGLLDAAETALLTDPSWPILARAVLAERSDDLETAWTEYERAREANPANWLIDYFQGAGALDEANAVEAQLHLSTALAAAFDFVDALDRLGHVALLLGDHGGARRYFAEAASRDETPERLVLLATALRLEGDLDAAAGAYRRARSMAEDEYLPAILGLGWVANAEGRYNEALEEFEDVASDSRYATDAAAAIRANLERWQWLDRFTRSEGLTLYRKWKENESQGTVVRIATVEAAPGDPTLRARLMVPLGAGDGQVEIDSTEPFERPGEPLARIEDEWLRFGRVGVTSLLELERGVSQTRAASHPVESTDPATGALRPTWVVRGRRAAVIEGTQVREWEPTAMGRLVALDRFERFEATVRRGEAAEALIGIGLFAADQPDKGPLTGPVFVFGINWKGELVHGTFTAGDRPRLTELPIEVEGDRHVLALTTSGRRRQLDLYLDGQRVAADIRADVPMKGGNLRLGVVGVANAGVAWRLVVEETRLIYREPNR